jgi:hypothetical protein
MSIWNYTAGAELPAITIEALDADGQPINFSSGWTFEVKVGEPGKTAVVTASTVTGAATVPNLTVNWTAGALDSLVVGTVYTVQIMATNIAGQSRIYTSQIRIVGAVL